MLTYNESHVHSKLSIKQSKLVALSWILEEYFAGLALPEIPL